MTTVVKTPVTTLQEKMMAKIKKLPVYELILDGGGTHINNFVYKVSCDGLSATGRGRSKKAAKQEAADAMLKVIAAQRNCPQLSAYSAESPDRTPLPERVPEAAREQPSEPFSNAVGNLRILCSKIKLNSPVYELVSDVGPPHAKSFIIQCKVTTFVETGIAKTKKLAKQEAAKKMLGKLKNLIPYVPDMQIEEEEDGWTGKKLKSCHEIAKALYPILTPRPKKISMGDKIADYHTILRGSLEPDVRKKLVSKLTSVIEDKDTVSTVTVTMTDAMELTKKFVDILASVNLEMSVIRIESKEGTFIVAMRVNSYPSVAAMSMENSREQAHFQGVVKLINSMITFLKILNSSYSNAENKNTKTKQ